MCTKERKVDPLGPLGFKNSCMLILIFFTRLYLLGGWFLGAVCSNDGYYFNDQASITLCSNGNAYRVRCAPGTQNSGGRHYSKSYSDFCTVNLNDYGYGASKYASQQSFSSGHGHGGGGYGHQQAPSYKPSYSPPKQPQYGHQPLKPRQHYPAPKVPVYMSKYH